MPDYRIEWAIDWPGDSPREAVENMIASIFLGWPQGVDHFTVIDESGDQHAINLYSPEEDETHD